MTLLNRAVCAGVDPDCAATKWMPASAGMTPCGVTRSSVIGVLDGVPMLHSGNPSSAISFDFAPTEGAL